MLKCKDFNTFQVSLFSPEESEQIQEYAGKIEALDGICNGTKVDLILVLVREKLATEVDIRLDSMVIRSQAETFKSQLGQLGFECELGPVTPLWEPQVLQSGDMDAFNIPHRQRFFVALSQYDAKRLKRADEEADGKVLGELFGFPKTAISAYISSNNPNSDLLRIRDLGVDPKAECAPFCQFALSSDHWREELGVAQRWGEIIKEYAPTLYREIQQRYRLRLSRE